MSDQYVGEIRMFAGRYAPVNWVLCNGQLLPIAQYEPLYALIGVTYGGDGRTTFAVPDLCGRIPVGQGQSPVSQTKFTLGQKGGTETVTLTTSQIPSHTHSISATSATGNLSNPAGNVWAQNSNKPYAAVTAATPTTPATDQMAANALSSTGGGVSHTNMMPYLPVNFIIATMGIFPTQS